MPGLAGPGGGIGAPGGGTTAKGASGGFWGGAASFAKDNWREITSGLYSAYSARRTNRQSRQLSQRQMDFQERMSSTAYQRSAEDLDKAGLNRILALGSPATTPGGAQPPKLEVPGRHAREGVATALQVAITKAQITNLEADAQLKTAQATETGARTGKIGHEIKQIAAAIGLTEQQTANAKEQIELIKGQAEQARQAANKLAQESRTAKSEADKKEIEAQLYQKLYGGDWGATLYYMKEMAIPLAMIGSSIAFGAARIPGAKGPPIRTDMKTPGRRIPKMTFENKPGWN